MSRNVLMAIAILAALGAWRNLTSTDVTLPSKGVARDGARDGARDATPGAGCVVAQRDGRAVAAVDTAQACRQNVCDGAPDSPACRRMER